MEVSNWIAKITKFQKVCGSKGIAADITIPVLVVSIYFIALIAMESWFVPWMRVQNNTPASI